jgi:transposase
LAKAQEAQKQLGIMQTEIRTASQEKDFDRQAKDAENWILKIYDKYNAMSEKDYNALIDETSRIKQDYNNAKIDLETAQKRRNIVLSRAVQFLAAYLGSATGIGWTTYHYMGADKRGGGE